RLPPAGGVPDGRNVRFGRGGRRVRARGKAGSGSYLWYLIACHTRANGTSALRSALRICSALSHSNSQTIFIRSVARKLVTQVTPYCARQGSARLASSSCTSSVSGVRYSCSTMYFGMLFPLESGPPGSGGDAGPLPRREAARRGQGHGQLGAGRCGVAPRQRQLGLEHVGAAVAEPGAGLAAQPAYLGGDGGGVLET